MTFERVWHFQLTKNHWYFAFLSISGLASMSRGPITGPWAIFLWHTWKKLNNYLEKLEHIQTFKRTLEKLLVQPLLSILFYRCETCFSQVEKFVPAAYSILVINTIYLFLDYFRQELRRFLKSAVFIFMWNCQFLTCCPHIHGVAPLRNK